MEEGSHKNERTIRIWTKVDIDEIKRHLMLIDDLYGSCCNCTQLGLNYLKDRVCPGCKTEFKYIAVNDRNARDTMKILARIQSEKIPVQLIERGDLEKATAKDALGDLFK